MRKLSLIAFLISANLIWGCQKSENLTPELNSSNPENSQVMAANVNPTSISRGMKNYESYFVSSKDGKIHGYIISVPLNYDPTSATKYPLLLFMHGDGEKPGNTEDYNLNKLKYHGPHKEIFNKGREFPAIIVSLQMARYEGVVNPAVVKELIDVITGEAAIPNPNNGAVGLGKYNVDMNRIHLTGLSQGGNGAFKTAYTYPSFFASISVFSGYTGSQTEMSKIKMPTYIRHNSNDQVVGVQNAYNAQKWIDAAGPILPVNFLVFNSNSHDAWSFDYGREDETNVYNWHWSIIRNKGSVEPGIPVPNPPVTGALSIQTLSPLSNSTISWTKHTSLTLLFNKNIVKKSGLIEIRNLTDGTSFKAYANWGMVSANSNKLTIYPLELLNNKRYSVRIEKGAITDEAGSPFIGILDDNSWTFNIGTPPLGNSGPSTPTVPPTGPLVLNLGSSYPLNNSTIARPSSGYITMSLNFNKAIQKGSGLIEVKNITDNTSYKLYANWGMVSTNNTTANIYPFPVTSGKTYAVIVSNNAIKDESNSFFPGISDINYWKFTVK
jgi:hypothetical protein